MVTSPYLQPLVIQQNQIKQTIVVRGSIEDSIFNFIPNAVEIKPLSLSIRQQQLLKINAKVNYGNETGMNIWTAKYSDTYILNNQFYGPVHGGKNEGKKRKRPFKTGNFVERVVYV